MTSIYEFKDYKKFLLSWLEHESRKIKGLRRQMADFAGCQVAYISHVLVGSKDFSLEQAEAIARFLKLRLDEASYFILLVQFQRAGTKPLKFYFEKQLLVKAAEHKELNKQVRIEKEISEKDQAQYYSSWHYQAVHSALTIPKLDHVGALSDHLALSHERVNSILSFLLKRGLIEEKNGRYRCNLMELHLPRTSPFISRLHSNWRIKTAEELSEIREGSHHYSGLMTLSAADVEKVKAILRRALSEAVEVVKNSKEERLYLMSMDFFEL